MALIEQESPQRTRLSVIPSEEKADPSVHLRASVSLLIHVETTLSPPSKPVGLDRRMALIGNLHLSELRAEFWTAHRGHDHGIERSEERRAIAILVPHGFGMQTVPQSLAPPPSEECDLWARTPAANQDPPWVEHYMGQLQGVPLTLDQHVLVEATIDVQFASLKSQNGQGASLQITGELTFERPTTMQFLFRDPHQSMAPSLESTGEEVTLIAAGSRLTIPSQIVPSMGGRHSSMTVRLLDAELRVVCVAHSVPNASGAFPSAR
jgi:hypothetical protein